MSDIQVVGNDVKWSIFYAPPYILSSSNQMNFNEQHVYTDCNIMQKRQQNKFQAGKCKIERKMIHFTTLVYKLKYVNLIRMKYRRHRSRCLPRQAECLQVNIIIVIKHRTSCVTGTTDSTGDVILMQTNIAQSHTVFA